MTLKEGASQEIISRWPEYKQRNVAMIPGVYGDEYASNMYAGIKLIRDHYASLKEDGDTAWSIPQSLSDTLDDLAGI